MKEKNPTSSTQPTITCDIVKDLLPSYVDGICSDDSRQIIEQHLTTCADCAALATALRESETITSQTETKQIAYLKKIKTHTSIKELLGLGILFIIIGVTFRISAEYYGAVSWIYFLALPLILFDTHFLLSDHTTKNQRTEPKIILTLAASLLICIGLLVAWISIRGNQTGQYPFGLGTANLGHFLNIVYDTLAICEFLILIAGIILTLKTSNSHGIVISISMVGLFLMFFIFSIFAVLNTMQGIMQSFGQSIYLLLEGAVLAAILALLEKRRLREG